MENNDNVVPDPINKSMDRGKWKSGFANLIFDDILINSRGKISDGIKSAMASVVQHVSFLRKPSRVNCTVIRTSRFRTCSVNRSYTGADRSHTDGYGNAQTLHMLRDEICSGASI